MEIIGFEASATETAEVAINAAQVEMFYLGRASCLVSHASPHTHTHTDIKACGADFSLSKQMKNQFVQN